jgi:hypothetical protein
VTSVSPRGPGKPASSSHMDSSTTMSTRLLGRYESKKIVVLMQVILVQYQNLGNQVHVVQSFRKCINNSKLRPTFSPLNNADDKIDDSNDEYKMDDVFIQINGKSFLQENE